MTATFAPLRGTVVLDLSRYLPGPLLTRILADLGATVVRIEPPGGDTLRHVPPHQDGVGVSYASLNAGKRSVVLDLKRPEGAAVLHAALAGVDVLVEGFRPGVLDRFGLSWDTLLARHPRLIGVSLSGYGQAGPDRLKAGHDLSYVARAGLLGTWGPADGPPAVPGTPLADVAGGTWPAALGVLAALLERAQTGRGRHLDVALARGAFALGAYGMAAAAVGHAEPRGAGMLTGGVPCYRCYATQDGRHLAVAALEPPFFDRLCVLVGRPDLQGSGYALGADGARVQAELEGVFASRPLAAWLEAVAGEDVCVEPVATPVEAVADPLFSDLVAHVDGRPVVRVPLGVPMTEVPAPGPLRALGADGEEALGALGVDAELVAAARAAGALG